MINCDLKKNFLTPCLCDILPDIQFKYLEFYDHALLCYKLLLFCLQTIHFLLAPSICTITQYWQGNENVTGQNTLLDLCIWFFCWLALAKVTFFYNALKLLLSILCHQILMLKAQVQEWIFFSLSIPWQIILVYNRITNMGRLEMSYRQDFSLFVPILCLF